MDKSPIFILKDSIEYPVEQLRALATPFSFVTQGNCEFFLSETDSPIYFVRRQMHVKGGKVLSNTIARICFGKKTLDGRLIRHWLSPEGEYLGLNLEPIK